MKRQVLIERRGMDENVAVEWALTGKIKTTGIWVRRVKCVFCDYTLYTETNSAVCGHCGTENILDASNQEGRT